MCSSDLPHVSDYGIRLTNYKAVNPNSSAYDFIVAELNRYADKFGSTKAKAGLDAVRTLMLDFAAAGGQARIRDVPEAQYPDLLALIDKKLAA